MTLTRNSVVIKHCCEYVTKHETSSLQNCFEYTLKRYTFENVTSVLAAVYVLLGRAVTEYR